MCHCPVNSNDLLDSVLHINTDRGHVVFTEDELRIIRRHLVDMGYLRFPTTEETFLIEKVTKLISELHFIKERDKERSRSRSWEADYEENHD